MLRLSPTDCNFLFSPDSDLAPPLGASNFGMSIWVVIPDTPSQDGTIYEATSSSGNDKIQIELLTTRVIRLTAASATSGDDTAVSSALSAGLHNIQLDAVGSGAVVLTIDGTQADFTGASHTPDTNLADRICIGRSYSGSDSADCHVLWLGVFGNTFSAPESTAIYNSGTPTDPTSLASTPQAVFSFIDDLASTNGTAELGCGISPTFVDDQTHTGVSWTEPDWQAAPSSLNLGNVPASGDADYVFYGDSFSAATGELVPMHILDQIADLAGTDIRKIYMGDVGFSIANGAISTFDIPAGGSITDQPVGSGNDYDWENQDTPVGFAVPPGGDSHEVYSGLTPSGNIVNITLGNHDGFSGPMASWVGAGDDFVITPVIRRSSVDQLASWQYQDDGGSATQVSVQGTASSLAAQDSFTCSSGTTTRTMNIGPPNGTWTASEDDKYFPLHGILVEKDGVTEGPAAIFVADNSWSITGHSVDQTTGTAQVKEYSDSEVEQVISIAHDPTKHLVNVLYIATEPSGHSTNVGNWITRTRARMSSLGITDYSIWVISPHIHRTGGSEDLYDDRVDHQDAIAAHDALGDANSDVAVLHIPKLDGGGYFHDAGFADSDPNDANGPQRKVLDTFDSDNGTTFATSPGQDGMLDANSLHPDNAQGPGQSSEFWGRLVAAEAAANGFSDLQDSRASFMDIFHFTPRWA